MGWPPQLYIPRPHDVQSGLLIQRFARRRSTVAAALAITHEFAPPSVNSVLWVDWAFWFGAAGAAQQLTAVDVFISPQPGSAVRTAWLYRVTPNDATPTSSTEWSGTSPWPGGPMPKGFIVLPGEVLVFQGNFSAAGVANEFEADVVGTAYPRGSWQRAVDEAG